MFRISHRLASLLALGLLAVSGTFLVLKATPEGLALSDDSIAYIAGARSLLAGEGYREAWLASNQPVTHFPPGFSALLAFIGLFGLDPLRGARFANALLFGLNTGLLGVLGWRMTRSLPAGLILAALFASNAALLRVHTAAMSEPLFIFLSLLAFWTFDLYFERDHHPLWLGLCAVFVGAAYLTRYAGLALVATFTAALFILRADWRSRLSSAGLFLAGFLPWMAGWAIRNRLVADSLTNRGLQWHPVTAANFDMAVRNVSAFLVPLEAWRRVLLSVPGFFEASIALILGALLTWMLVRGWNCLRRPQQAARPGIVPFANGLYVFAYLASILASMSLFDASTKFKLRILAPVYVALLILLVALGVWLWRWRGEVALALTVALLGFSIYEQTLTVQEGMKRGGQGFASFQWYDSEALAFLRTLPPEVKIYTNEPAAVYLYTGRGTYVLPSPYDPVTASALPGFEAGATRMRAEILAGEAVLALFDGGEGSVADVALLTEGLYLAHKSAGDEIYTLPP